MRRVASALLVMAAALACHRAPTRAATSTPVPRIPRDAPRFEIDSVTDSTAIFRVREARWIRPGDFAYVVDPLQRDALVARLRIVQRGNDAATALVTSQVAVVKPSHVLLVMRPPDPFWKRGLFWAGAGVGTTLGAVTGALILRE